MPKSLATLLTITWIAGLAVIPLLAWVFGVEHIQYAIPLWLLLPIPVTLVWRTIEFFLGIKDGYIEGERSYRRQTNRCLECGYSLRGNVSDVCPECGSSVSRSRSLRAIKSTDH